MAGDVHDQFIGLQQNGQYDVSYRQGFGRNPSSADSNQTIVEGIRGFGCTRVFGKSVTGQGTPLLVIERVWRWAIVILQVMDRPASLSGEERAFGDAVGVEVGENCHGLI